jgi:hypothetical protein
MKPNFNFKYYKEDKLILTLIVLYIFLEFIIGLIIILLEKNGLHYYRFYPATVLLAIIFGFANSNLHKVPTVWNFFMKIPLIKGIYEGSIMFIIDGKEIEKKCKMKIYQNASKIKVDTIFWNEDKKGNKIETSETISESSVEDLLKNERDNYELHFFYSNGGSLDSKIPIRMGYNVLKYDAETKIFKGIYFSRNSIAEGNGGKIKLVFKNKI